MAIKRSKEIKTLKVNEEKQIMEELSNLIKKDLLSEDDHVRLRNLHAKIDEIYIEMAKGAFMRSRAKWFEEGEKNTSYFFSLEKRNWKRNNICALKLNDQISTNPSEIAEHVYSFYKNLYKSNFHPIHCDNFKDTAIFDIAIISEEYKLCCEKDILRSEIAEAIHSMKKGKSPGIDGLSNEFYVHFWELIEKPLLEMYEECISREELSPSMKQGLITLLPKPDKDKLLIENWRPITLLNVITKCFPMFLKIENRIT